VNGFETAGPRKSVTRQDVARYAGVSTAVISYVINSGPKGVAPATRERVLEAIRVLGYRPNAAARALKLGSTELLGLIVPDITNPYFAELSRAIEEVADERGYALLLTNSAGEVGKERKLLRKLISRQIDGLLLASVEPEPDLSAVSAANIPVALLDRGTGMNGVTAFGVDYRASSREGVRHLIEHGHSDIGLVVGGAEFAGTAADREHGWLDALTEAGLPEGPVARGDFSRVGGYDGAKRLMNREHPPTAIFASSDMQAIGVLRALHEAGLDVPGDVAVVSFDGSIECEFSWPPLTAVRQPVAAMAKGALDMLTSRHDQERDGQQTAKYLSYPTQLVTRSSCGCAG
jgi:LacI family transcriptional regulator